MAGGRKFGKYLLHEQIAVGGMGELYLATVQGAAKGTPPLVLKILLPEYSADSDFVSMFHDEARIGMQLKHPNVVAVSDLGRVADTPYIVLEYVHGENLKNTLRACQDAGEKFPAELAVMIAIETLYGLDHAHHALDARGKPLNLVHRDLSPDNVIMSFEGDVKILDFGIAKAEGRATQTQFGILKGKAQYMSPEQAIGGDVDCRTDIFSLGLVLLEVVTGERRFGIEADPVQQIRDARTWRPYGPSEKDPSLPVELDAILLKALQADPKRRWQSAEEFAVALTRLLREKKLPRSREQLPMFMRRLFPGRAEPYLTEDPTSAGGDLREPSVLQNAFENTSSGSPALPAEDAQEVPSISAIVRARLSPAAPTRAPEAEVTNGAVETTAEGRPVGVDLDATRAPRDVPANSRRPTGGVDLDATRAPRDVPPSPRRPTPSQESTEAGIPADLRSIARDDAEPIRDVPKSARSKGRAPSGSSPDEPTIPPARARATPAPPPPRRASAPLPEIPSTYVGPGDELPARPRLRSAVDDPRGDENDDDAISDGTRAGDFGGGTSVAIQRPGSRAPAAERDWQPERATNKNGGRNGGYDPSADERRAVAGKRNYPTGKTHGRPSFFLLFVLTLAMLAVGSAAAAIVFKEQLPPEMRARIEALTQRRLIRDNLLANNGATATTTPTEVSIASPAPQESAAAAATVTATPTAVAIVSPTPKTKATPVRGTGGGIWPVDNSDPTPTPGEAGSTSTPRPATPRPTPAIVATEAAAHLTPVPRASPRETQVASVSKDKAMVRLSSKPAGIEILIDGIGSGKKTPATVQVDPGVHTLSLKADGYRPWNFPEELKAGDTLSLTADLVPGGN